MTYSSDDRRQFWLESRIGLVKSVVKDFTARQIRHHLAYPETQFLGRVLLSFVGEGKGLRSVFAQLGWLCGEEDSAASIQACASLELLHAFALIQDDVMDGSIIRRGMPSIHVQLERWHHASESPDDSRMFGNSAAILLSDICIVWADQMLREARLPYESIVRAWPSYDLMRTEMAVGQFRDLLHTLSAAPDLVAVTEVARQKSGNYTVRRPLEFGAALSGCGADVLEVLGVYGSLVGEAFQYRDDFLGVFGSSQLTGKPVGDDLRLGKATALTVLAQEMATPAQQSRMTALMAALSGDFDDVHLSSIRSLQELLVEIGARDAVERLIDARVREAETAVKCADLPTLPSDVLVLLAKRCAVRSS
ncbi:polyprenyl synthetase family protein [Kribbella sp. CA-294648]|uniref:polyprenyl synthetase family protein n=1 Tax=Kribbella sp. CA-294648 TaxID=3239948 RepID=UPI003D9089E9